MKHEQERDASEFVKHECRDLGKKKVYLLLALARAQVLGIESPF